jgi:hypothetical protein
MELMKCKSCALLASCKCICSKDHYCDAHFLDHAVAGTHTRIVCNKVLDENTFSELEEEVNYRFIAIESWKLQLSAIARKISQEINAAFTVEFARLYQIKDNYRKLIEENNYDEKDLNQITKMLESSISMKFSDTSSVISNIKQYIPKISIDEVKTKRRKRSIKENLNIDIEKTLLYFNEIEKKIGKFEYPSIVDDGFLRIIKDPVVLEQGEVYIGEWNSKNERHGKGILIWNSTIYQGLWENDNQDKKGRLILSDGTVKEGEWKNGEMTGKGIILYPDGGKYQGDVVKGRKKGQGTFEGSDGSFF